MESRTSADVSGYDEKSNSDDSRKEKEAKRLSINNGRLVITNREIEAAVRHLLPDKLGLAVMRNGSVTIANFNRPHFDLEQFNDMDDDGWD